MQICCTYKLAMLMSRLKLKKLIKASAFKCLEKKYIRISLYWSAELNLRKNDQYFVKAVDSRIIQLLIFILFLVFSEKTGKFLNNDHFTVQ